jgi:hypothetical protein
MESYRSKGRLGDEDQEGVSRMCIDELLSEETVLFRRGWERMLCLGSGIGR